MVEQFDRNRFDQEVRRRLRVLDDPWKSAAFTGRAALLVLSCLPKRRLLVWCEESWFSNWLLECQRAIICNESVILLQGRYDFLPDITAACYSAASSAADAAVSAARAAKAAYVAAATAAKSADAFAAARTEAVDAPAARAAFAARDAANAAADAASSASGFRANKSVDFSSYVSETSAGIMLAMLDSLESASTLEEFLRQPLLFDVSELCSFQREYGSGFEFWADWLGMRCMGQLPLIEVATEILMLSKESLAQSPREINAYLQQFREGKLTEPLNRVRAIFIGYGLVGKTSLIRALHGESVVTGMEPPTPGIAIREWLVPDTPITADLWDFGGQVMAHATHQFFLRSRCLYVVVLDGRAEVNADDQASYWLEHVKAYGGGGARVMLVCNKADDAHATLNLTALREKYSSLHLVGSYLLSCTKRSEERYSSRFDTFQSDFIAELQQVGLHQTLFSKAQSEVLQELRTLSQQQTFMDMQAFADLCRSKHVKKSDTLGQDWLLDLFDKLGIIIHFPKIATLDKYLLNPRWLTHGIYTLLYSELSKQQQGRITLQDVVQILKDDKSKDEQGCELRYSAGDCNFIVQAMEQFEVGFRVTSARNTWVIPALLPTQTPPHGFSKADALRFDFDFDGFLPRSVLPSLIVRRHDEIENGNVWQNGVHLRSSSSAAEALLQADYHDRRLSLWVRGPQANDYFNVLRDEVHKSLKKMPDLPVAEWVWLPDSARVAETGLRVPDAKPRAKLATLLAQRQFGQQYYFCEFGQYDLTRMGMIMAIKDSASGGNTFNNTFNIGSNGVLNASSGGDIGDTYYQSPVTNDQRQQVIQHLNQLDTQLESLFQQAAGSIMTHQTEAVQVMQILKPARDAIATLQSSDAPEADKQQAKGVIEGLWDGSGQVISGLAKGLDTVAKGGKAVVELNGLAEKIVPYLPLLLMAAGS